MTILEIIQLRTGDPESLRLLGEQVRKSVRTTDRDVEVVTIYRRVGLETDLSVQIRRHSVAGGSRESEIGLRLASSLRAYGLVEHTLWEELI